MATPTKTRKVAVYPDGSRYPLHFSRGYWWWGKGRGDFPQSAAIDSLAQEEGGWIEVEPNPEYTRWRGAPRLSRLMKGLLT